MSYNKKIELPEPKGTVFAKNPMQKLYCDNIDKPLGIGSLVRLESCKDYKTYSYFEMRYTYADKGYHDGKYYTTDCKSRIINDYARLKDIKVLNDHIEYIFELSQQEYIITPDDMRDMEKAMHKMNSPTYNMTIIIHYSYSSSGRKYIPEAKCRIIADVLEYVKPVSWRKCRRNPEAVKSEKPRRERVKWFDDSNDPYPGTCPNKWCVPHLKQYFIFLLCWLAFSMIFKGGIIGIWPFSIAMFFVLWRNRFKYYRSEKFMEDLTAKAKASKQKFRK